MKIYITILSAMFMLNSCGTEEKKVERNSNYDYVEIAECTIPVLKEFKINEHYKATWGWANTYYYNTDIMHEDKQINVPASMDISIRIDSDKYVKYIEQKELLLQRKRVKVISDKESQGFRIIEWHLGDNSSIIDVGYKLFGPDTNINLHFALKNKKEQLDYLLDYCQKTWKLNKKKEK